MDRLLELHFKYLEKVEAIDEGLDEREENEDENYLKRLEGGLFTLQLVDYIIVEVCAAGPVSVKQRVMQVKSNFVFFCKRFANSDFFRCST